MSLLEQLRARLRGKVVVVGVGNPLRGDDAAGSRLAQRLQEGGRVHAIDAEEVPENILGLVVAARPDVVVLVDAVDLGADPGAVALIEEEQITRYCPTTHRVPLGVLAEYLAQETGADVLLVGIQPRQVQLGSPMCSEVEESVDLLAGMIEEALAVADGPTGRRLRASGFGFQEDDVLSRAEARSLKSEALAEERETAPC